MLGLIRGPEADPQARRRLEAKMHAALGLGPDDVVRASEVACGAAGCGGGLTALIVMRAGRGTEVVRATAPLAGGRPEDFVTPVAAPTARAQPLRDMLAGLGG